MSGWRRASATGQGPCPRYAHTATPILTDTAGKLYVIGGWNGAHMLADVYAFDHTTLRWKCVPAKEPPGMPRFWPRSGHTAVMAQGCVFVFGGGDGSSFLNDLWELRLDGFVWNQLNTAGSKPCARSRHTAVLLGGAKMCVFGGGDDSRVYNDIYVLDTLTLIWEKITPAGNSFPAPRWGHCAVCVSETFMLVFGGHDGSVMLNDLWVLDSRNWQWTKAQASGDIPFPRAAHAMCVVDKETVCVCGGGDGDIVMSDLFFLKLEFPKKSDGSPDYSEVPIGFKWVQAFMPPDSAPFTGRCAHTISLLKPISENETTGITVDTLMVFGGGDKGHRFKDVFLLNARQAVQDAIDRKYPPMADEMSYSSDCSDFTDTKVSARGKDAGKGGSRKKKPRNMEPILQFLRSIGLESLFPTFEKEDVTLDTLPLLSERHLEMMGITSMGIRLRLLAAIRKSYGHISLSSNPSAQKTSAPTGSNKEILDALIANQRLVEQVAQMSEQLEQAAVALTRATTALNSSIAGPSSYLPDPFVNRFPLEPQAKLASELMAQSEDKGADAQLDDSLPIEGTCPDGAKRGKRRRKKNGRRAFDGPGMPFPTGMISGESSPPLPEEYQGSPEISSVVRVQQMRKKSESKESIDVLAPDDSRLQLKSPMPAQFDYFGTTKK